MKDQINTIRAALYDWEQRDQALTALSNLESHLTQYEAGDMASAAAQGFRDGVASVAQQHVHEADCGNINWKAQYEHQKRRAERWIAKYEADIGPLEKVEPQAEQQTGENNGN